MENTRLVNLRDPRKNRKKKIFDPISSFNEIHIPETIFDKQSRLQSFVARALKRDIALCFLPLVIAHLIANVDLRLHLSFSLLESIGGRIYLSPRLSGIRKIRLAIKSSFPATGRGRLPQVHWGKRKRDRVRCSNECFGYRTSQLG